MIFVVVVVTFEYFCYLRGGHLNFFLLILHLSACDLYALRSTTMWICHFVKAVFDVDLICWSSTYTFILLNVLVTYAQRCLH